LPVEIPENLGFDLKPLGGRFYNEFAVRKSSTLQDRRDSSKSGSLVRRCDLVLCDFAIQILPDCLQSSIYKTLLNIAQHHVKPGAREHMGNAIPHRPRAHYTHALYRHDCPARTAR